MAVRMVSEQPKHKSAQSSALFVFWDVSGGALLKASSLNFQLSGRLARHVAGIFSVVDSHQSASTIETIDWVQYSIVCSAVSSHFLRYLSLSTLVDHRGVDHDRQL